MRTSTFLLGSFLCGGAVLGLSAFTADVKPAGSCSFSLTAWTGNPNAYPANTTGNDYVIFLKNTGSQSFTVASQGVSLNATALSNASVTGASGATLAPNDQIDVDVLFDTGNGPAARQDFTVTIGTTNCSVTDSATFRTAIN